MTKTDTADMQATVAAIRGMTDSSSDDELRESLQRWGWVREFPAIDDERGMRLVGNRRTRIANELGIAPVVTVVKLGSGDAADAERFKLAFVSNIGAKPLTAADRKRIAIYLYAQRSWTQQRIGEALGVGQQAAGRYLEGIYAPRVNVEDRGTDTLGRKKSSGRPKAPPKPPAPKKEVHRTIPLEVKKAVAEAVLDGGKSIREAAREAGISHVMGDTVVAREHGRREAIESGEAIDPATFLTLSAKEKLETAIRVAKAKLEREYEQRVQQRVARHFDEYLLPNYKEKLEEADRIMGERHHFMMPLSLFKRIRNAIHPDMVPEDLRPKFNELFVAFNEFGKTHVYDDARPKLATDFPRTLAELMQGKAQVDAERAAKRAARKAGQK